MLTLPLAEDGVGTWILVLQNCAMHLIVVGSVVYGTCRIARKHSRNPPPGDPPMSPVKPPAGTAERDA